MQFFALIILFFLITAIFPVLFWIIFFSYQDKKEPEPQKMIIYIFLWGVLIAFCSIIIKSKALDFFSSLEENLIHNYLFSSNNNIKIKDILGYFALAAFLEEIIKFSALMLLIFTNINFNQVIDGVVYATTLALGFSFVENSIYFFEFYQNLNTADFYILSTMRGLSSVLLHVSATGIIGFYLGKAKFNPKKRYLYISIGIFLGSLLHIFFNLILQTNKPYSYLAFIILVLSFIVLVLNIKTTDAQHIWWNAKKKARKIESS